MVHGLWSSAEAWGEYPGYLREAHSFAWRGHAVGADPRNGRMNTGPDPAKSLSDVAAGLRSEEGKTNALRLFDDGRHDDGEAGDGVYGGRSADGVKPDDYFVEVHAGAAAATGFVTFKR